MSAAGYRDWPKPARSMAVAVDAAVTACKAADPDGLSSALTELAKADGEQVAMLLGSITGDLIERAHPDGLDSEGAELMLQSCIRSGAGWFDLDTDALIRALTGALGVIDADSDAGADDARPRPSGARVVAHGLLLIADLLTGLDEPVAPAIDAALRELMRAQTIELP